MSGALTDLAVQKLPCPSSGQKTYWDNSLPGFGVRCSSRSKSFVVMYGPRRQLKTLGRYPQLGLADARKRAKRFQVGFEELPASKKQCGMPFPEARDNYLVQCNAKNRERTVRDYTRILKKHFKFTKSVREVDRRSIMRVLNSLSDTPSEQKHAYVVIKIFMNWCVQQDLIDFNPVPPMRQHSNPRDRILNDSELLKVLKRAGDTCYPFGAIVELLILTGQRRGEVSSMRRSWNKDGCMIFPSSFTKNRTEHRLPLTPRVRAILDSLPELGDLYFPSRTDPDKPFNGWGKCKARFDDDINVEAYTLHDLRRTFSSSMARLGTPIYVTEKLLNHISGTVSGVAAIYNQYSYADEMRDALNHYESYLFSLENEKNDVRS